MMQNPAEVKGAAEAQVRARLAEAAARIAEAQARVAQGVGRSQLSQSDQWEVMRQGIRNELAQLENRRDEISSQLQNALVSGANRAGLERRIEQIDTRIAALETQNTELESLIARANGQAITVQPSRVPVQPRPQQGDDPFLVIGGLFMVCVALPLSIAYARRLWRRGGEVVSAIPSEIAARLARIEQNVDTVALEVERIGESQRFLTRAIADQRGLNAGAAEPVVAEREKDFQRRP